jgi:predicted unusual protein kinase regulating ubiquinone biosynthesis (AarF/ABC1/UbiB family)
MFKNDFNYDFDEMIELDEKYKIKSGSIAQVYKGKFKKNNTFNNDFYNSDIAIKVIHPELKYQMFFIINFVYFYKYIVNNIVFLNKYDTIFNFESFFENLKLQTNMANEYKNMNYFYDYYYNNEYIVIPYPLHFSKNILIMQYVDGELFDNINVSEFEKKKIIMLFNLFLKDQYFFSHYFHLDLHDYNWRVNKYKDFYQLLIYDFGYIIKNNIQNIMKDLVLYSDTNNIDGFSDILYNNIITLNIKKEYFTNNFKNYIKKFVPYTDDSVRQIYNFCYINNYKLKNSLLEIFISMMLIRKNFNKYIFKKYSDLFDYNFLIELNFTYITLCEKYNIFLQIKDFIKNEYLNNQIIKNKYSYENKNYDLLENKEESIII